MYFLPTDTHTYLDYAEVDWTRTWTHTLDPSKPQPCRHGRVTCALGFSTRYGTTQRYFGGTNLLPTVNEDV